MGEHTMSKMRSLYMMAVNKLFEDLSMGSSLMGADATVAWRPPTDVYESDDAYVVRMAISGLKRRPDGRIENAEVIVENDVLTVRGSRQDDCPHNKCAFYQMEIHYGYFECRVRIHAPFDRDNVRAEYRDGFLNIFIPKAQKATPGTHRIHVQGPQP